MSRQGPPRLHYRIRTATLAIAKAVVDAVRFPLVHRPRIRALKRGPGKHQVLLVCPNFDTGGGERVALDVVRMLSGEEFSFHAITTDRWQHRWHAEFREVCVNAIVPEKWRFSKGGYARYLKEMIEHLGIEVLLFYENPWTWHVLPEIKERFPNLKVVDITHCEYEDFRFAPTRDRVPLVDARACISNALVESFQRLYKEYGLPEKLAERLHHINNGIDVPEAPAAEECTAFRRRLEIPDSVPVIAWAARFTRIKNPCLAVETARTFFERNPESRAVFVVAGDGVEMENAKARRAKYSLEHKVVLPGMLRSDEVLLLLGTCDALMLTSTIEGVPLILCEAMILGKPVVSTICGAIPELIEDERTGYLVSLQDDIASRVAERLDQILADPESHAAMGKAAREHVMKHYTKKAMREGYRRVFDGVVGIGE